MGEHITLLYLKENIYLPLPEIFDPTDPEPFFDPYNFIIQALVGDRDIFHGLKQEEQEKLVEKLKVLFPHASNYG